MNPFHCSRCDRVLTTDVPHSRLNPIVLPHGQDWIYVLIQPRQTVERKIYCAECVRVLLNEAIDSYVAAWRSAGKAPAAAHGSGFITSAAMP